MYIYMYTYTRTRTHTHMWSRCQSRFATSAHALSLSYSYFVQFYWWVPQHCTGFARLVWGRLRVHRDFVYSDSYFVQYACKWPSHLYSDTYYTKAHVQQLRTLSFVRTLSHTHTTALRCTRRHTHIHAYTYSRIHIFTHTNIHAYTYSRIHIFTRTLSEIPDTGWRRLIGCLKLQVLFGKRATNCRALLRMTCKDKASCRSSPRCTSWWYTCTCAWAITVHKSLWISTVGEPSVHVLAYNS